MRILLIVPTFHYKTGYPHFLSVSDFPQGYAYLAASLKKAGHEVVGLNLNNITGYKTAYDMIVNRIHKALEEVNPDLIGIGGLCIDYSFIKDAIQIIRMFSKAPIVLGGGIVNNDAEYIFNLLKPDYAIVGEAEQAIMELANTLSKGLKPTSPIIKASTPEVDSLAFPDYETFGIKEMMDKYSMTTRLLYRYSRTHPRPMIITTARSCPFNCTFCVHNHGSKYRARSIENIMAEIKQMYEKYQFNILIVIDELFAVNKKRMVEFCTALLEGKERYGWDFDWMFQTHANAKLDYETMAMAKKAGCFLFSYGLESASPEVLKSMNKKTKISQIVEAIKIADDTNVGFSGNLLFGDPAETPDTVKETLNFYHQYSGKECIFLSLLMPYPGSKLFDYCQEKGLIKDKLDYYENIDKKVYNMTSMPYQEWLNWVNFTILLEQNWFIVKGTDVLVCEREKDTKDSIASYYGAGIYSVEARCPHCGEVTKYRQVWNIHGSNLKLFLGTICTHCNRRIKINIKGETKVGQVRG